MAKPSCLIKISGSLLEEPKVFERIAEVTRQYSAVVLVGGGKAINERFIEKGWPIKFCPLGRICETPEQKREARNVLEQHQDDVEDLLDERGITARVVIPVRYHGNVLCHENGDIAVLDLYLSYNRILVFTTEDKVEAKREWLKRVAECFRHIAPGELDKIEVVGF